MTTTPSAGLIAFWIVTPILVILLALAAWFVSSGMRRGYYLFKPYGSEEPRLWPGPVILAISALLTVAAVGTSMWPFEHDYHHWVPKHGVVAEVEARQVATDGGGMEEKFVVTFEGGPQEYGVADTRAATLGPGDELWIKCKRAFQWAGTDGWDCVWVKKESS